MLTIRDQVAKSVGEEVTRLREKHGLSVKELHCESGVSLQTILMIEGGHVMAHNATLSKLLKAMHEEELSI